MKKKQITYVDPPSGHKWNFPKPLPEPKPADMRSWLVENGYPEREVDFALKHCRMWIEEE